MEFLLALFSGATLGLLHAFDIDHVVAVSNLTGRSDNRWAAARMGGMWGLGHTAILLLVGAGVTLLGIEIPASVQEWSEVFVGCVLIGLGAWSVRAYLIQRRIHLHRHTHDGTEHVHFHSHADDPGHAHTHSHSLFALGMTHGFAGSGAVVILIPLTLSGTPWLSLAFLGVFGLGSTIAMGAFSLLFSMTLRSAGNERVFSVARAVAGFASIAVGIFWVGERLL
jgi:hypothetical protein